MNSLAVWAQVFSNYIDRSEEVIYNELQDLAAKIASEYPVSADFYQRSYRIQ